MKLIATMVMLIFLNGAFAQNGELNKDVAERQPKAGFFGDTTSVLSTLAQDLFSRSTTNSQVLSLNITNLVILLIIKALIFGAGSLGFGGSDHLGRSIDDPAKENIVEEPFMSQSELLLMLSYLKGGISNKYGCLHYAACKDPRKAKQYLLAGRFVTKGASIVTDVPDMEKYDNILTEVQEAANFGQKGYDCSIRYTCGD